MPLTGSCHPGANAFTMEAALPQAVTRCTCSFCCKRGALHAECKPTQFRPTAPERGLATHRWNTRQVAPHFSPTCGCATHSDSPDFQPDGSWEGTTRRIAVNAWLIDGFDAATVIDGRNLW
ncbi:GFA family protein [Muricoccus radiodurans]|uniref:GFA family protein n=1 Tax=Muricoccus radiodurans TaxID=2231721 RepID=UPI003CEC39BE